MSTRFDVCSPRKRKDRDGNEKTWWVRVGAAFTNEKGTQVVLDALPLPDENGRCVLMLFEPKDGKPAGDKPAGVPDRKPGGGSSNWLDMDDDIPL